MTNDVWRDFFIEKQESDWPDFSVCDNGGYRPVKKEELALRKIQSKMN